jgi:prepilin-type N-terminal cleavage/methylation domain-containing protein
MRKQTGFTLVEISIVLVIIGLILGAVFVGGQALVASAKTTGTITLIKDLTGAMSDFKNRYHYLPGDLPNAAADIQNITVACNIAASTASTTKIGDGLIEASEQKCVVEELVLAGFMKGSSTAQGFVSPLNQGSNPDVTVRWVNNSAVYLITSSSPFPPSVQNVIEIQNIPCDAATTIDNKLDDGETTAGNIRTSPPCVVGASGIPATTTLDVGL